MPTESDNKQNSTLNVDTNKRFKFDFEQFAWNNQQTFKCNMAKNAQNKIENERQNIENDLKMLKAIEQEIVTQKNVMTALFQVKEELEKKLNHS